MKKQKPPVVSFGTRVSSTMFHLYLPESSRNRVNNLVDLVSGYLVSGIMDKKKLPETKNRATKVVSKLQQIDISWLMNVEENEDDKRKMNLN